MWPSHECASSCPRQALATIGECKEIVAKGIPDSEGLADQSWHKLFRKLERRINYLDDLLEELAPVDRGFAGTLACDVGMGF